MGGRTILAVDDEKVWLRVISGEFSASGHKVLTALTCAEGLALTARHRPDCVLLDYHLPDAEADVFCERVRTDPGLKKTPIIIISADEWQESAAHLKCQADGFVLKGCRLNTIRLTVESLLRRIQWERGVLEKGDLRLDPENFGVFRNSTPVASLSREQFRFLYTLMERSNSFVSEEEGLKFVFGADAAPEKYEALRGLADRLRAKLGPGMGRRIKSSAPSGWIYVQPDAAGRARKLLPRRAGGGECIHRLTAGTRRGEKGWAGRNRAGVTGFSAGNSVA